MSRPHATRIPDADCKTVAIDSEKCACGCGGCGDGRFAIQGGRVKWFPVLESHQFLNAACGRFEANRQIELSSERNRVSFFPSFDPCQFVDPFRTQFRNRKIFPVRGITDDFRTLLCWKPIWGE